MNGVDISGWQRGIDTYNLDADFVIIKITEGYRCWNDDWKRQAEQTLASGKLLGFYHYADGLDPYREAECFWEYAKEYEGRAIFVLDWEGGGNPAFGQHDAWTSLWRERFLQLSGIEPFLYSNPWCMPLNPSWSLLWVAQYPNYVPTGYQEHPWNEGAYECHIRQYSSVGQIRGYAGNLDINKSYFGSDEWRDYSHEWKHETEDEMSKYTDYRKNEEMIKNYYQALLHREADFGGLMLWVDIAVSGSLLDVVNSFLGSREYQAMDGNDGISRVRDLYYALLGRECTDEECQSWLDEWDGNLYSIASGIFRSDEAAAYRAKWGL